MPSRRQFLQTGLTLAAPGLLRSAPTAPCGVQVGDVIPGRAMLWSRSDRPARMLVSWKTAERSTDIRRLTGPHLIDVSDYTGRVEMTDLPAGQQILYEVQFEDLTTGRQRSEPIRGTFRTPPAAGRNIRFVWSGDVCGQGWGIDRERGGMRGFDTMRQRDPDFFIHSGDTIYADNPIPAEVKLADGSLWRNIVTPEKSKVAETLDEFRGCYRYNLMDDNVRRFNAQVPQIWQWDDHEVMNNWSPAKRIDIDARYREKNVPLLVARAKRAFLDYAPLRYNGSDLERVYRHIPYGPLLDVFVLDMRSYRGPNTGNRQTESSSETDYLGAGQLRWLAEGLRASKAVWKVIAADMPIGVIVPDELNRFEASANGDGPVLGRELEFAELFRAIKRHQIHNTVWLTADVHYTAAHYYDPAHAQFTDFLPFWEFISGPLHAGTFGPGKLDNTFGPQVVFQKAPPPGQSNLPPSAGYQFFGEVEVNAKTQAMTVTLRDTSGAALFTKEIAAALLRRP